MRVRGLQDLNQFYRLDVTARELPEAGSFADLNLDGVTNIDDWQLFLASASVDLTGLTLRESLFRGDLDADGDNDHNDFKFFKSAYNLTNGAGALELLQTVPEPQTLLLVAIAACGFLRRRR